MKGARQAGEIDLEIGVSEVAIDVALKAVSGGVEAEQKEPRGSQSCLRRTPVRHVLCFHAARSMAE